MATSSEFGAMLREYAPNQLLENEIIKLNWFIRKVKKDPNWSLGAYQIPIEMSENSRFEFDALPASNDIPGATYALPEVSSPAELFGSLKFNNKDLERHDGDLKKSFLSIAPKKIKQFVTRLEEQASLSMLGDGSICTLTANGTVGGVATVNRPWLLTNGQKVILRTSSALVATGYVNNIDINAKTFKLVTAAGGSTGVDISGQTTALSSKVYTPGAQTKRFTSLIDIVFPTAMGGADTLYGGAIVKANSPVLQPFVKDISASTTRAALKASLFSFYYEAEQMGRNENRELLVPYSVFQALALETEGTRQRTGDDVKTTVGAKSMKLQGPDGDMVVTAIRDMVDGFCVVMDWDSVVLASRGELIKKANKMGGDFFEERATSGYTYIVDKKMEAELIVTAPGKLAGAKVATAFTA